MRWSSSPVDSPVQPELACHTGSLRSMSSLDSSDEEHGFVKSSRLEKKLLSLASCCPLSGLRLPKPRRRRPWRSCGCICMAQRVHVHDRSPAPFAGAASRRDLRFESALRMPSLRTVKNVLPRYSQLRCPIPSQSLLKRPQEALFNCLNNMAPREYVEDIIQTISRHRQHFLSENDGCTRTVRYH